jgi:hypothetical protein
MSGIPNAQSEYLLEKRLAPMLSKMKQSAALRAGQLLLRIGGSTVGLVLALLGTLREFFAAGDFEHDDERQPLDTDLTGELNHRTGRLDAGNDPFGWYGDD